MEKFLNAAEYFENCAAVCESKSYLESSLSKSLFALDRAVIKLLIFVYFVLMIILVSMEAVSTEISQFCWVLITSDSGLHSPDILENSSPSPH